ncbi:unnamed protein product [Mycena citricolor]|uniref:Uncharacterized protein n=1 Tax=Mycena citricolor TaxID=2018698 RepID=A0AAD2HBV1_9AGAR|nr:unnamed protein product [Mycena citricolor]
MRSINVIGIGIGRRRLWCMGHSVSADTILLRALALSYENPQNDWEKRIRSAQEVVRVRREVEAAEEKAREKHQVGNGQAAQDVDVPRADGSPGSMRTSTLGSSSDPSRRFALPWCTYKPAGNLSCLALALYMLLMVIPGSGQYFAYLPTSGAW